MLSGTVKTGVAAITVIILTSVTVYVAYPRDLQYGLQAVSFASKASTVHVLNDNFFEKTLETLTFEFKTDDLYVGKATSHGRMTVPARSSKTFHVPVNTDQMDQQMIKTLLDRPVPIYAKGAEREDSWKPVRVRDGDASTVAMVGTEKIRILSDPSDDDDTVTATVVSPSVPGPVSVGNVGGQQGPVPAPRPQPQAAPQIQPGPNPGGQNHVQGRRGHHRQRSISVSRSPLLMRALDPDQLAYMDLASASRTTKRAARRPANVAEAAPRQDALDNMLPQFDLPEIPLMDPALVSLPLFHKDQLQDDWPAILHLIPAQDDLPSVLPPYPAGYDQPRIDDQDDRPFLLPPPPVVEQGAQPDKQQPLAAQPNPAQLMQQLGQPQEQSQNQALKKNVRRIQKTLPATSQRGHARRPRFHRQNPADNAQPDQGLPDNAEQALPQGQPDNAQQVLDQGPPDNAQQTQPAKGEPMKRGQAPPPPPPGGQKRPAKATQARDSNDGAAAPGPAVRKPDLPAAPQDMIEELMARNQARERRRDANPPPEEPPKKKAPGRDNVFKAFHTDDADKLIRQGSVKEMEHEVTNAEIGEDEWDLANSQPAGVDVKDHEEVKELVVVENELPLEQLTKEERDRRNREDPLFGSLQAALAAQRKLKNLDNEDEWSD